MVFLTKVERQNNKPVKIQKNDRRKYTADFLAVSRVLLCHVRNVKA